MWNDLFFQGKTQHQLQWSQIVCFIQAFLFKRCAYITHNAIRNCLLHIFRCFLQVSDISFPLDATRDFFSEHTTTSLSFYWKWIPSHHSPVCRAFLRRAVQWNQRGRTVMLGFLNAKERPLGSEARQKQFGLLNLGSMVFLNPCSSSWQKHVCCWRAGCKEQLRSLSAWLLISVQTSQ